MVDVDLEILFLVYLFSLLYFRSSIFYKLKGQTYACHFITLD